MRGYSTIYCDGETLDVSAGAADVLRRKGLVIAHPGAGADGITGGDWTLAFVDADGNLTAVRGPVLTQVEFGEDDFPKAERIAAALGYEQTAYTSTSNLWGLFCLPENPAYASPGQATTGGCIIKTRELGFLFVQHPDDLGIEGV